MSSSQPPTPAFMTRRPFPSLGDLLRLCLPSGTESWLLSASYRLAIAASVINFAAFACMWWADVPGFAITFSDGIHLLSIPFGYLSWYKAGMTLVKVGGPANANRFDSHSYLLMHSLHAFYAAYMAVGVPGSGSAGAIWWEAHFEMGRPGTALACMASMIAWAALALVSMGGYARIRAL
ncbi:hypothetical protein BC828DRAFT_405496 [Blastocladiella britannica]|nr:hypothetical protein BC828DRAFT_405496 [Blastocladiella britannica]